MNILKTVVSIVLYRLGIFLLIRFSNRNRLTIITYHSPDPDVLEAHFNYLSKKYQFITIDRYYEIIMKGEKLPRYSLLVTFDDGYKSNVELLPVLDRYKCIPIVYVCSAIAGTNHPFWDKMVARKDIPFYKSISNKERLRILQEKELYTPDMVLEEAQALTFKNIAALKGRVTFGSHTRTHGILTRSTNEEQEDEIITSKKELEKICGEPVVHFSYPNGDYNRYSLECVKKAGYLTSRTVKPGWNDAKTDMFQLKQCMISDDADVNILRLQMSGIPGIIRFVRKPGRLSYKSHNFSG